MKTIGYIYKIISPTGRIYIGSTKNLNNRFKKYKNLNCKNQTKLYNSLKKYGWENHTVEVVEEPALIDLLRREAYWGKHFDVMSNENLNLSLPKGYEDYITMSEETRKKMSEARKKRVTSDETKARQSKSRLGSTRTEEQKFNISLASAKSKLVLDTYNGIYYNSAKEASFSTKWSYSHLKTMLNGRGTNTTNLIYID